MTQKIYFVTGKGGVGKSTVAAALAYKMYKKGQKTILVELGKESFYSDFFNLSTPAGFKPQTLSLGFDLALLSPDDCLKEYALHLLKLESLYKLFFQNQISKSLIEVAPGLKELAILGKITSKIRSHGPPLDYNCIVVDAYATGHFLALVQAPLALAQAIPYGPMGEQSRSINEVLRNKDICSYFVVSLPEELPMKEAHELKQQLKDKLEARAKIILNRSFQQRLNGLVVKDLKSEDVSGEANKNYIEQIIKFLETESELHFDSSLPVTYELQTEKKVKQLAEFLNV